MGLALDERNLNLIKRLAERLEHLSADSIYAHRASGLRGSLLRSMERIEVGERLDQEEQTKLEELMKDGFQILELAAKEIGASK